MTRRLVPLGIGLVLVILGAVGAALWRGRSSALTLHGTIEARHVQVGSRVGGRVLEVRAREGQAVKAGDLLVALETDELQAQAAEAEAAVRQAEATWTKLRSGSQPDEIAQARAAARGAEAALRELEAGPRPEAIARAQAALAQAESDHRLARVTAQRHEDLWREGAVARQQFDDASARMEMTRAAVRSAQAMLNELLAGTRPEQIAQARQRYQEALAAQRLVEQGPRVEEIRAAEAALAQARARLELVRTQLRESRIVAPVASLVEVLDLRPGDLVAPNQPVAKLLEPDQTFVRVYLPETRLGWIAVGQAARISVDSFPGRSFAGVVEQINAAAEYTPRNVQTVEERADQVFGVKVAIREGSGLLRAGMAASVTLEPRKE
jgi:multidrug resistance efflux pump